ncbi:glycosyltransferase [bacterium J17]|nr:glycosyltransferase [bacterium J17]
MSIIVPVYNEAAHLFESANKILSVIKPLVEMCEVLFVDDGSTDESWAVIGKLQEADTCFKGVRLSRRFGKELALCAGLERARGELIVVMDADLQHPPELLPEMLRLQREEHFDVVEAVKKTRGIDAQTSAGSASLFYKLFHQLAGFQLEGATDYKLITRRVLDAWLTMPERNVFYRGMSAWLGFKRAEIEFDVSPRVAGASGWSRFSILKLAVNSITSFSSLPLHFITLLGCLFMVFSVCLGALTLYYKLVGTAVSGFTTVILLQLIIGSMVMIGLGAVGT